MNLVLTIWYMAIFFENIKREIKTMIIVIIITMAQISISQ